MSDAWLEELSLDECQRLLLETPVGRIATIVDGLPLVLPVNYVFVTTPDAAWIALRTRPGNTIDRSSRDVAFEIDGVDPAYRRG